MNRRSVIFAAGGAGLALVGGLGVWRVTRMPRTATAPWTLAEPPPADVRLDALRHAILAPNPHNRQPWLMRLEGDDAVLLSCDLDRRLPETDPFDRQLTIGFGAFIELARIAAAQRGVRMTAELFPEGEPQPRLDARPLARLRFTTDPGVERDPLYPAILERRSNKQAFDRNRIPGPAAVKALLAEAAPGVSLRATAEPAKVAEIRQIVIDAFRTETRLPRTFMESVRLIRIGHGEIDASPDGIDLGGPLFEGLHAAGQIDRQRLADPKSALYRTGLDQSVQTYEATPAFLWLVTAQADRAAQIAAGRVHVRTNLAATAGGLSLHPVSQALQEFPEMAEDARRMQAALGAAPDERVQMLCRLGYGPAAGPSPRWPLETRILPA